MDTVRHLIVGAGITGLSTAAALDDPDFLVIEGDAEIGGYCKTIKKEGFTWDYSGHFFHFKHPEIEAWLKERMVGQRVLTVKRVSKISFKGTHIDFPFQKNIHQLPREDFIECLHDLFVASKTTGATETNFLEMLQARFGKGICDRFLVPYNEKLYACDLRTLDKDAMGRFFPHANLDDIIRNMKAPTDGGYNATFTYPEGGAIEYVKALASVIPKEKISLQERLEAIDLKRRIATTSKRQIHFERLVSSAPFHHFIKMTGLPHDTAAFTWNKVLVFNLGFDRKGPRNVHWIYYPDRARSFYRVGFYDNIFDSDRLSIYVELGFPRDAQIDVQKELARVQADLLAEGVIGAEYKLLTQHSVVMDPAYVHITRRSMAEHARLNRILKAHGVYVAGRYGGWTYCSIEDNIVEARGLAADFNA